MTGNGRPVKDLGDEMTLHRTIDFREFDGLLVERAMADLGFDSRHVRVVENLFEQGATVDDVWRSNIPPGRIALTRSGGSLCT